MSADADAPGAADELDDARPESSGLVRAWLEWIIAIGGAVAVAVILQLFVVQPFYIPSESMEPTLVERDRVLVSKLSYRMHDVNRGDIVVFERPPGEPESGIHDLIKRVIGLEGEVVEAHGGDVYVDGRRLVEPYLDAETRTYDFGPILIPDGQYFVMGDNRTNSHDSRAFGPIDEDLIVGRAFVRVWPLSRVGVL